MDTPALRWLDDAGYPCRTADEWLEPFRSWGTRKLARIALAIAARPAPAILFAACLALAALVL